MAKEVKATAKQKNAAIVAAREPVITGEVTGNPRERMEVAGIRPNRYATPIIKVVHTFTPEERLEQRTLFGSTGREFKVLCVDGEIVLASAYGGQEFYGRHEPPKHPSGRPYGYGEDNLVLRKADKLAKILQHYIDAEGLGLPPTKDEVLLAQLRGDLRLLEVLDIDLAKVERRLAGGVFKQIQVAEYPRVLGDLREDVAKQQEHLIEKIQNLKESMGATAKKEDDRK